MHAGRVHISTGINSTEEFVGFLEQTTADSPDLS